MVLPLGKLLITLVSGPRLRRKRFRAVTLTGIAAAFVAIFTTMVPLPSHTTTEGVVWLPQDSSVKAAADGFVRRVVARPGDVVHAGDLLVEISDPDWDARIRQIEARVEELDAQYVAARFDDRAKARVLVLERENEKAALARENLRKKEGFVRSLRDGVFVFPAAEDAQGRFVREGAVLGYVTPPRSRTLRIVVAQSDIDLVRNRIDRIEVKLRDRPDRSYRATIARTVPAAADELPSKAFGLLAGGQFGTDPRDPKGTKTLQRLFQFDLELAEEPAGVGFGTRAYVRFDLRPEPLGAQIYRRARQLFLTRFNA
jgi:putative peptide zinc metalloprotease protein